MVVHLVFNEPHHRPDQHGGSFNITTVTLGGLNIGDDYLIQTFVHDGRGSRANALTAYSNGVDADADTASIGELNVDGTGQFIIGTFTADTATQTFDVFGEGNQTDGINFAPSNSQSAINAIQLRNVTVPEPSSVLLIGLGGVAFLVRRRK